MKKFYVFLFIFMFQFYILIAPSFAFAPSSENIYEGIDVSDWQGYIDYSQVADSGIEVVYIRASEGFSYVDSQFENNYTNAKSAGLKVGFYHYLTARTIDEAKLQAQFFASTISGKSPDCKLAIDFESFGNLDNNQINEISVTFLQTVQNLTGKEVVVYSDEYNANNVFNSQTAYYALWVAQYEVSEPTVDNNWTSWEGWQYTDQGEISGISGYVDRDKFTEDIFIDSSNIPSIPNIPDSPSNGGSGNNNSGNSNSANGFNTITIEYGDTLSELAIEYNTTVARLVALNNISNPNLIYAGNTLVVPISDSGNSSSTDTQIYVVQSDNTLSQIALEYNTTVTELAYINNISNVNLIYTGQILYIPTVKHDTNHTLYVVKSGDTLWAISRRFGVSIAQIVMLNRISNPNLIYPGNVLRI